MLEYWRNPATLDEETGFYTMATNRRLVLGNPPFQFLARHLADDSDFLRDVKLITDMSQDNYVVLAKTLSDSPAFLDQNAVRQIIEKVLGQGSESKQLGGVIFRLSGMLNESDMPPSEALSELGKALEEHASTSVSQDQRSLLVERLNTLAIGPKGLTKQSRARRLADATGSELDEFEILNDIRPVFDADGNEIDGVVPLTIFHAEYTTADGDTKVIEFRITAKQMKEMGRALDSAIKQLAKIRSVITDAGIVIAKTKATAIEDE